MFYEALEQEAENQHLSEIAIPMLVGSKLDISQDVFVNIQLFSILMGEDVEARRSFITRNARDVRFLDV